VHLSVPRAQSHPFELPTHPASSTKHAVTKYAVTERKETHTNSAKKKHETQCHPLEEEEEEIEGEHKQRRRRRRRRRYKENTSRGGGGGSTCL
jgi:hypothetical protein